jgi:hypothetical protein
MPAYGAILLGEVAQHLATVYKRKIFATRIVKARKPRPQS